MDTFKCLSAKVDASLLVHSPAPAASTLETSAAPTPETSSALTLETSAALTLKTSAVPTPATLARAVSSNSAVDSAVEIPVARDVIQTCVTLRKVQRVREAFQKEVNRQDVVTFHVTHKKKIFTCEVFLFTFQSVSGF